MVTINDIAKALNVAKSTVSNALTNNRYVNPELKARILQKCEEMQFQPNFFATSLSKQTTTNIIGLFLELGHKPRYQNFYSSLIQSVIQTASKKDFSVLIYYGLDAKKVKNLLGIGKSPIDGAILLSPEVKDARSITIEASQIPYIYIGQPAGDLTEQAFVDFDNTALMMEIVGKLTDLGHEHILFINSKKDLTISRERTEAYKKALEKHQLNFDKDYIYYSDESSELDGQAIISHAHDKKQIFTAVITANDLLAKGVYDTASEDGMRVGNDVSVIALGGETYIDQELNPQLSHAYQDYQKIGKIATKFLLQQMFDKEQKKTVRIYKSELFITDSIGVNKAR